MKNLFFLALAAMSVATTGASATTAEPADTTHFYSIDGHVVRHFTGKELVGKTIKSYQILPSTYTEENGKGASHVMMLHKITTNQAPVKSEADRPVVFIDGKQCSYDQLNALKTEDIKSVTVIKNPKLLSAYAKQGISEAKLKNGVLRIVTKQQQTDCVVYVVNGKEIPYKDLVKIPTENIKSVNVFKKGSASKYAKQYGSDAEIVEITTK